MNADEQEYELWGVASLCCGIKMKLKKKEKNKYQEMAFAATCSKKFRRVFRPVS